MLTPQLQQQKLNAKKGSALDMVSNDYINANTSLFSNREERKNFKFKKNGAADRGYGKQKYSSQKASSTSSTQGNPGAPPKMGVLPHSLLEKEIRHMMNQSQLVQSTKEHAISFNQGSNLRRIANQRMSAMSNYDTGELRKHSQLGSQSVVGGRDRGSQVIRQGKVKARQVNSFKDGFRSVEKKPTANTSFSTQKYQP